MSGIELNQMCNQSTVLFSRLTIALRGGCNYACHFCAGRNQKERFSVHSLPDLNNYYNHLKKPLLTSFECGGAEPTLHPQMQELLELSLSHGVTLLFSNNSISPAKWAPRYNQHNLLFNPSLHPEGEADLDGFVGRLMELLSIGVRVEVNMVLHPERMDKIREYLDYFAQLEIKARAIPFIGYYRGRNYPNSHTREEKRLLSVWGRLFSSMKTRDFFGIPCLAGHCTLYVNAQNRIQRCLWVKEELPGPLGHPQSCPVHFCGCGLLLAELHLLGMVGEYETMHEMMGLPQPFKDKEDAFNHSFQLFESLMKKYGKPLESQPVLADWSNPHLLFRADSAKLFRVLERNCYGAQAGEELVEDPLGLLFKPTSQRDHLAIPYLNLFSHSETEYPWLRISLNVSIGNQPSQNLAIFIQDESFLQLGGLITLWTDEPSPGSIFIHYLQVHPDIQRIRLVIRSEDNRPIRLPLSIQIEQSSGAIIALDPLERLESADGRMR